MIIYIYILLLNEGMLSLYTLSNKGIQLRYIYNIQRFVDQIIIIKSKVASHKGIFIINELDLYCVMFFY